MEAEDTHTHCVGHLIPKSNGHGKITFVTCLQGADFLPTWSSLRKTQFISLQNTVSEEQFKLNDNSKQFLTSEVSQKLNSYLKNFDQQFLQKCLFLGLGY